MSHGAVVQNDAQLLSKALYSQGISKELLGDICKSFVYACKEDSSVGIFHKIKHVLKAYLNVSVQCGGLYFFYLNPISNQI